MDEVELERMVVRLLGDTAQYIASMEKASDKTERTAKDIEKHSKNIEGFQKSIRSWASTTLSALGALGALSYLKQAFAAFSGREEVTLKLNAVIAANGREVEKTTKQYKEFAKYLTQTTTMSGTQVLGLLKTAESYGLTGDAAMRMVKASHELAAITGTSPESLVRMTAAVEKGDIKLAMAFARMVPQLRHVKDETAFLAKYNQLLAGGTAAAAAEVESANGRITQLQNTFKSFLGDLGETVAEGIKPFVEGLMMLVSWLKTTSPETKRWIVVAAAAVVAILAIGPALSAIAFFAAPVIGAITTIVAGLAAVGPEGLLVAGIIGTLGYEFLSASNIINDASDYISKGWVQLTTDAKIAGRGIRDAFAAGDFQLVFDILWVQIQLSFARGMQPLKEMWVGLTTTFKVMWANMGAAIQNTWNATLMGVVTFSMQVQESLGLIPKGVTEATRNAFKGVNAALEQNIEEQRRKAVEAAMRGGVDELVAIQAHIAKLEAERDKLVDRAHMEAVAAARDAFKAPDVKPPPQLTNVKMHIIPKFDAAEAGSIEALHRIQEFREKATGERDAKRQATPGAQTADVVRRIDKSNDILTGIREAIKDKDVKPKNPFKPADV